MSLNGKRDGFSLGDFPVCAKSALMKRGRAETIVNEVRAAGENWSKYADHAHVADIWRDQIQRNLRLDLPRT